MDSKIYSLPTKVHSLRRENKTSEAQIRNVSDLYEKQFLGEMLKAMRSTVNKSGLIQENMAEKIFQGKLDDEYIKMWNEKGGIGLSDIIYNQIMDKYGAALGLKTPEQKPQGPIALDHKSQWQAVFPKNTNPMTQTIVLKKISENLQGAEVGESLKKHNSIQNPLIQNPWKGKLLGEYKLDDERKVLEIAHENGLKSKLVFMGTIKNGLEVGQELESGQDLGQLSPQIDSVLWKLEGKNETPTPDDRPVLIEENTQTSF